MGKWERRAEMAQKKRDDAKDRKQKRSSRHYNVESVVSKLLRNDYLRATNSSINGYIGSDDERPLCPSWCRLGTCEVKRCRKSHEATVSDLHDVIWTDDMANTPHPHLILCPLRDVEPKDYQKIVFISVNRTCVYDKHVLHVWENWRQTHQETSTEITPLAEEPAGISDDDSDEDNAKDEMSGAVANITGDDNYKSNDEEGKENENKNGLKSDSYSIANSSSATFLLEGLDTPTFSLLLSFCVLPSVCALATTCRTARNRVRVDDFARQRKREFLTLHAKEISRRKKEEKRKKAKQANLKKVSKKDSYTGKYCG